MFTIKRKIFSCLGVLLLLNLFFPHLTLAGEATLSFPVSETAQNLSVLPISNSNKEIVISLSQERLVAYDGGTVFLQTPVTTGGSGTPTPAGTYRVLSKLANFVMSSPWPSSDWRWYSASFVHYGLLYQAGGYFIHDASWRHNFGPGSNSVLGIPGGNYTGTHGCVNVPLSEEATLYAWAQVGTPVIVQP